MPSSKERRAIQQRERRQAKRGTGPVDPPLSPALQVYSATFSDRVRQVDIPGPLFALLTAPVYEEPDLSRSIPASRWAGSFGHWEQMSGTWHWFSRSLTAPSGPVSYFRDIGQRRTKCADGHWRDVPQPSAGRVPIPSPEVLADVAQQEASRRRITRPAEVSVPFDERDPQDWTPAR